MLKTDTKLKHKAIKGGPAIPLNLIKNWIHQGFFYLDRTEQLGRVILEIIPTLILFLILRTYIFYEIPFYYNLSISLLIVHTLNWIFNDNWWACIIFAFPKLTNPSEKRTITYLNTMSSRIKNDSSISGLLIFGSVVRGKWHDRSDLDLRILRHAGLHNGICGYIILVRERIFAIFHKQPLDIYLADDIKFLKKMREDEPPFFLIKNDSRLDSAYPAGKEAQIQTLRRKN